MESLASVVHSFDRPGSPPRLLASRLTAGVASPVAGVQSLALRGASPATGGRRTCHISRFPCQRGCCSSLEGCIPELSGSVPNLSGFIPNLSGFIPNLSGRVRNLPGSVRNLSGCIPDLSGSVRKPSGCIPDLPGSVRNLPGCIPDRWFLPHFPRKLPFYPKNSISKPKPAALPPFGVGQRPNATTQSGLWKRRPLFYFAMDVWGERTRLACGFGRRARNIVGQISWLTGFRRDAENGNRDIALPIPNSVGDDVRSL